MTEASRPARSRRRRRSRVNGCAYAHPKLDIDSVGAARFQAERPGFGARHVLVQIEGGIGLRVFGPVAAGPLAPAHHHVLGPGVECPFAITFRIRLTFVALKRDNGVFGTVDVQHRNGGRPVAARVLDVARTGQARHGPKTWQTFAGHVVRHEPAVGVAEEVHRPEVLDLLCACYQLSQISDIILAGLAAIAAPVGGVPELVSPAVSVPLGSNRANPSVFTRS